MKNIIDSLRSNRISLNDFLSKNNYTTGYFKEKVLKDTQKMIEIEHQIFLFPEDYKIIEDIECIFIDQVLNEMTPFKYIFLINNSEGGFIEIKLEKYDGKWFIDEFEYYKTGKPRFMRYHERETLL